MTNDYAGTRNSEQARIKATAINEAATTWLPAIQFGKAGDPEDAVKQYREALTNAGIDDYMEELVRQMKEYEANN